MVSLIPPTIYCPKCGKTIRKTEVDDDTKKKAIEQGYSEVASYICKCGLAALLCTRPLPASPTFELLFNVYKVEEVIKEYA